MAQSSIGTTAEASNIMRLLRNRSKSETKEFMDDFTKHLKIVLDSLEGTQKVFWLIESDMAKHEIRVKLGATLGIDDLPFEVRKMVAESEAKLREKEDGKTPEEHAHVTEVKFEGEIPAPPRKTLEERLREIEKKHPEPKEDERQ
jgi:hypothetical protein